jgi:hypothetical protein
MDNATTDVRTAGDQNMNSLHIKLHMYLLALNSTVIPIWLGTYIIAGDLL